MLMRGPAGQTFEFRVWPLSEGPLPRTLDEMREPDEQDVATWLAEHPGWRPMREAMS